MAITLMILILTLVGDSILTFHIIVFNLSANFYNRQKINLVLEFSVLEIYKYDNNIPCFIRTVCIILGLM